MESEVFSPEISGRSEDDFAPTEGFSLLLSSASDDYADVSLSTAQPMSNSALWNGGQVFDMLEEDSPSFTHPNFKYTFDGDDCPKQTEDKEQSVESIVDVFNVSFLYDQDQFQQCPTHEINESKEIYGNHSLKVLTGSGQIDVQADDKKINPEENGDPKPHHPGRNEEIKSANNGHSGSSPSSGCSQTLTDNSNSSSGHTPVASASTRTSSLDLSIHASEESLERMVNGAQGCEPIPELVSIAKEAEPGRGGTRVESVVIENQEAPRGFLEETKSYQSSQSRIWKPKVQLNNNINPASLLVPDNISLTQSSRKSGKKRSRSISASDDDTSLKQASKLHLSELALLLKPKCVASFEENPPIATSTPCITATDNGNALSHELVQVHSHPSNEPSELQPAFVPQTLSQAHTSRIHALHDSQIASWGSPSSGFSVANHKADKGSVLHVILNGTNNAFRSHPLYQLLHELHLTFKSFKENPQNKQFSLLATLWPGSLNMMINHFLQKNPIALKAYIRHQTKLSSLWSNPGPRYGAEAKGLPIPAQDLGESSSQGASIYSPTVEAVFMDALKYSFNELEQLVNVKRHHLKWESSSTRSAATD
jgi:hypothetical protein